MPAPAPPTSRSRWKRSCAFCTGAPSNRDADAVGQFGAAQPIELDRIETHPFLLEQGIVRKIAADHADHAAVLRRRVEQMVGRDDLPAAGHILRNDGGIARDIFTQIAGDNAGPLVVIAAGRRSDNEADLLAAVKILHRIGQYGRDDPDNGNCHRHHPEHFSQVGSSGRFCLSMDISGKLRGCNRCCRLRSRRRGGGRPVTDADRRTA